jgi:hypothetical protein
MSSWSSWGDWELVPDISTNRDEWFTYWDDPEHGGNGSGMFTLRQVVKAFSRTLPEFDKSLIESIVHDMWFSFDEHRRGLLDKDTLMKPQTGLIDTAHMVMLWSM